MSDEILDQTRFRETIITGVLESTAMTGVSGTQIKVPAGKGVIVDSTTNLLNITRNNLVWQENLTFAITFTNAIGVQYIFIDSTGAIQQQSTLLTPSQKRTNILLGGVFYQSGVITEVVNFPQMAQSIGTVNLNMIDFLPDSMKLQGAIVTPTTLDTLTAFIGAGSLFQNGINHYTDPESADESPFASIGNATTPATYTVVLSDDTPDSTGTSVFPKERDIAGTPTALTGKRATIHYLFVFGSNLFLQMGQTEYNDAVAAFAAATADFFAMDFIIGVESATLLAQVIIGNDATDFSDSTKAQILNNRGGSGGSSGGGGSTFSDAVFRVFNDADNTKEIDFDATAVATSTKRTITMPNADVDLTVTQKATTTLRGTQENATQAEVNAGTLIDRSVTPIVLKGADFVKNTSAHITIVTPGVRIYRFRSVGFAGTIESLIGKMTAGTVTVTVKINGVNVTNIVGKVITTTESTTASSGAKTFAIGADLEFDVTAISTPDNAELTLRIFQTG